MALPISTAFGVSLKNLDILIVDDNANMRLLLRTILRSFGLQGVRQARDGTTGLAEIERRIPSLIISDWEMAPMNGADFMRAVRRVGREPSCFVPIVVLTAYASRDIVEAAFDQGATQLLVKPVTPANLLQRINWVLEDDRPFEKAGDIWRQEMRIARAKPQAQVSPRRAGGVWSID
ncbi:response regulator [Parvibaculum sp.]|uniref:response regulator n=1 Tax=Parvibaculum sp. TaxID=2024848 RepID=UPI002B840E55|nr:response regulator [Parvibaculum sp.]HUD50862.1 response regulator [Parvibaculum sp.]